MLNVGIDIGGTKIAGGVVAPDGRILERLRVPTPTDTDALARAVADMVAELAARHEVNAVGVAAAGYIDRSRSVMLHAPNIDWHDAPLRGRVAFIGIDGRQGSAPFGCMIVLFGGDDAMVARARALFDGVHVPRASLDSEGMGQAA